jgi:hypothetical protein
LIFELITVAAAVAATVIAGAIGTITATIAAAIIAATVTATVDTARRRNIDSAARRRGRRRNIAAAAGPIIAAAPVPDGTIATIATGEEAIGLGRNGGGNECESCRGHDGDPAEFQHHDTSPVIYFGGKSALGL